MKIKIQKYILGSLIVVFLLAAAACAKNNDLPVPPELPEDIDSLVLLAKFDLSLKTNINIEDIDLVGVEETKFNDASLDVPEPGVEYASVITPGYIILLKAGADTYEYHASGERVIQVPIEE